MEHLKKLHAEHKRKEQADFDLYVQSEMLRIQKAASTISEAVCAEAARNYYIKNGYFSPYLAQCQTVLVVTRHKDGYYAHASVTQHFEKDKALSVSMCAKGDLLSDEEHGVRHNTERICPDAYCYKVALVPEFLIEKKI